MESLKQPLTNVQLEMLKAFSHDLDETDLKRLKNLLARFFASIATEEADKVWDSESWDEAKVQSLLDSNPRKQKS